MSKIKTSLPEDFDIFDYDYPTLEPEMVLDDDLPTRSDWAMRDLESALNELEVYRPTNYLVELETCLDRLTTLINDIKAPF